jgi:hypothetical protein
VLQGMTIKYGPLDNRWHNVFFLDVVTIHSMILYGFEDDIKTTTLAVAQKKIYWQITLENSE